MFANVLPTRHGCGVPRVTSATARFSAHIPNIIGKFVLAVTDWRKVIGCQPGCDTLRLLVAEKKSCYNNYALQIINVLMTLLQRPSQVIISHILTTAVKGL